MEGRDRVVWTLVALASFAYLFFLPTLSGNWVLDDSDYILQNGELAAPFRPIRYLTRPSTLTASASQARMMYRPVTALSFRATKAVGGYNPFWHHLTSILLHAANVCLVFLIARRYLSWPFAAAAALIFCVHPAQAESVAYMSGSRATLLSFLLCAAAFLTFERWRWTSVAAFAAAMFSKESSFFLLPVLLAQEWTLGAREESWREKAARWAPYGVTFTAYVAARRAVLGRFSQRGLWENGFSGHWRMALHGTTQDLINMVWPVHLRACYSFGADAGLAAHATILLSAAGVAVWALWKRRTEGFWLAWILAGLLPVANIVPIEALAADRFLYVSLAGLAVLLATVFSRLRPAVAGVGAAALIVFLGAFGAAQQRAWQDQASLDFAAYAAAPDDPCAALHLSTHYVNWGMYGRAQELLRDAMRPDCASHVRRAARVSLAVIRMKQRRWSEAIAILEEASREDPRQAEPHEMMSLCARALGDMARADVERETARRLAGDE